MTIPPPPLQGINLWVMSAACRLQRQGCSEDQALAYLRSQEPVLRRRYQRGEVERAVAKVYGTPSKRASDTARIKLAFNPRKLRRVAQRIESIDFDWFRRRSPIDIDGRFIETFLHTLSNPGERILCFQNIKSQGQYVWEHLGGMCLTGPLQTWRHGLADGAWFLPQPVTGEFLELERLQGDHNPTGRSRRCEECITSFRWAVLESDEADTGEWLRALAQLPLPITSIVTSGGRSIHALVLINAASKEEWVDAVRGSLAPIVTTLGADAASLSAVRLTRLPFVHRGAQEQLLLFLNDNPKSEPIANLKPIRY